MTHLEILTILLFLVQRFVSPVTLVYRIPSVELQATYKLSLTLMTHSLAFMASLASSTDVKEVATLRVGCNALKRCFITSSGVLNGPCN